MKKKVELATFRCGNCELPFPLDYLRHCPICDKDFCKECAEHGYHIAHRRRGPKVTEMKAPKRTPGYYYTLLYTVVSSALFIISLIVYFLVEPPLQDIIGKALLLNLALALVIGAHHIWKYRIKGDL